jgi:hypothetical protein
MFRHNVNVAGSARMRDIRPRAGRALSYFFSSASGFPACFFPWWPPLCFPFDFFFAAGAAVAAGAALSACATGSAGAGWSALGGSAWGARPGCSPSAFR